MKNAPKPRGAIRPRRNPGAPTVDIGRLASLINQIGQEGADTTRGLTAAAAAAALRRAGFLPGDKSAERAVRGYLRLKDWQRGGPAMKRQLERALQTCGSEECALAYGSLTASLGDETAQSLAACAPFAYEEYRAVLAQVWRTSKSVEVLVALIGAANTDAAALAVVRGARAAATRLKRQTLQDVPNSRVLTTLIWAAERPSYFRGGDTVMMEVRNTNYYAEPGSLRDAITGLAYAAAYALDAHVDILRGRHGLDERYSGMVLEARDVQRAAKYAADSARCLAAVRAAVRRGLVPPQVSP